MKLTWYNRSLFCIEAGMAETLIDPFRSDSPCWDKGCIGCCAGGDPLQAGGR
jgi:L-ascorbate metabolism protein UlaG (beta-lactamase superfamily)